MNLPDMTYGRTENMVDNNSEDGGLYRQGNILERYNGLSRKVCNIKHDRAQNVVDKNGWNGLKRSCSISALKVIFFIIRGNAKLLSGLQSMTLAHPMEMITLEMITAKILLRT